MKRFFYKSKVQNKEIERSRRWDKVVGISDCNDLQQRVRDVKKLSFFMNASGLLQLMEPAEDDAEFAELPPPRPPGDGF